MLTRFQRALRRVRQGDRGITVVELIVYMAVVSVLLTLTTSMFINVARTTTTSVDRRSSTAEAQNMLDVLATDIRAATNIPTSSTTTTWAVLQGSSATSLTLITYTDAGPTFGKPYQVQFFVDGSKRLVLQQWNPPATGTAAFPNTGNASVVRYLGTGVQGTSLFTYADKNGNAIAPGALNDNLDSVASITVKLTVQAPRSSVPVAIQNTIYMPNAGLSTAYAGAN